MNAIIVVIAFMIGALMGSMAGYFIIPHDVYHHADAGLSAFSRLEKTLKTLNKNMITMNSNIIHLGKEIQHDRQEKTGSITVPTGSGEDMDDTGNEALVADGSSSIGSIYEPTRGGSIDSGASGHRTGTEPSGGTGTGTTFRKALNARAVKAGMEAGTRE
jgi:hypothetical protein